MSLGSQSVEVVPRTRVKHGQYVDGAPILWFGLSIQPMGSEERHALGQTGSSRWNIFAPPGFPVSTENVIRWRGLELQVDGQLQEWWDEDAAAVEYVGGVLKVWDS